MAEELARAERQMQAREAAEKEERTWEKRLGVWEWVYRPMDPPQEYANIMKEFARRVAVVPKEHRLGKAPITTTTTSRKSNWFLTKESTFSHREELKRGGVSGWRRQKRDFEDRERLRIELGSRLVGYHWVQVRWDPNYYLHLVLVDGKIKDVGTRPDGIGSSWAFLQTRGIGYLANELASYLKKQGL